MKTFNAPAIEVEKFMIADVIAASGETEYVPVENELLPDRS